MQELVEQVNLLIQHITVPDQDGQNNNIIILVIILVGFGKCIF